jgi:hypothetical protein
MIGVNFIPGRAGLPIEFSFSGLNGLDLSLIAPALRRTVCVLAILGAEIHLLRSAFLSKSETRPALTSRIVLALPALGTKVLQE